MRLKSLSLIALVLLGLVVSACATLRNADGSINVHQVISDARFGLESACDQLWVPADACRIGLNAFTTADAIVSKNLPESARSVRLILVEVEAKLSADNRLRPYLDGAILLLPS